MSTKADSTKQSRPATRWYLTASASETPAQIARRALGGANKCVDELTKLWPEILRKPPGKARTRAPASAYQLQDDLRYLRAALERLAIQLTRADPHAERRRKGAEIAARIDLDTDPEAQ